jgi:hypothetical protein
MQDRRVFLKSSLTGVLGLPALAQAADPWMQVPAILRRITSPIFPTRGVFP